MTAREDPSGAASASGLPIRLGQAVRFPVLGGDAEHPVLAMNASGRFLIAYPQNDPFGSFGMLVGRTRSGRIPVGQVLRLGTRSDISPLEPAVAADGRVALGWSVRRQLQPANRVAFGQDLAERAPGAGARWAVRSALAPITSHDPDDASPAPSIAFDAGDRVLEDWTAQTRSTATLVLARQTVVGGPLRDSTVLRTHGYTTIQPAGLAVDGAGNPIVALSLSPPANASPSSRSARPAQDSAVALTASSRRHLGAPQLLRRGCDVESLAAVSSGQAAVAMLCDAGRGGTQLWVSERAPHELFQRAMRVSGRGAQALSPSVSIAADGRVCLAWDRAVGTAKHYDANIVRTEGDCAAPGSRFPAPNWQTGPYPTQLNGPQLLAGPSGPTLARGDGDGRVVLQRLLPGGQLGPVAALSGPQVRNQTLAVDARGHGIGIWDASVGHKNRPEARGFTLP